MQNSDFWTRITSLYCSQTWPVVLCIYNSVISTRNTRHSRFQPSSVVLCNQNSALMTTIACVYGSQNSPVIVCLQNSMPSFRNTSLYGSQPSLLLWSVILCMQNSLICTRMTCLYGLQPSSVVFACKIAHFGLEFHVSMGPKPHLWFWAHITACLTQE